MKSHVQYITNSDVTVGIIPEIGGTIVYVSKQGSPNLIKSNPELWDISKKPIVDAHTDFVPYCGHTVWLGPQKEWWSHQNLNLERKCAAADWPPDPYLYISEYLVVQKSKSTIHLVGKHSPISGVTIEKEIAINPDGSILVQATVRNTGTVSCSWDVWHNTRFDGMCKVYVATKRENVRVVPVLSETSGEMPYEFSIDGFSYCPQKPHAPLKELSSKAFIYPIVPQIRIETPFYQMQIHFEMHKKDQIHPDQGLVEIYNHTELTDGNDLLEVEYHSPYKTLEVGEEMSSWEVWNIIQNNMDIEKIKSEEEYESVLQKIDLLMNAKKGTPEYEELQHLTDLVEDFEDGLLE